MDKTPDTLTVQILHLLKIDSVSTCNHLLCMHVAVAEEPLSQVRGKLWAGKAKHTSTLLCFHILLKTWNDRYGATWVLSTLLTTRLITMPSHQYISLSSRGDHGMDISIQLVRLLRGDPTEVCFCTLLDTLDYKAFVLLHKVGYLQH